MIHINGAKRASFDLIAFEDNVSIYTALRGYSVCLENNPKYNTNDTLKELKKQSLLVTADIKTSLAYYKYKEKLDCNRAEFYARTKEICRDLNYEKEINDYASLAVDSGEFDNISDAIKSKEEKLNNWSNTRVK